MKFSAARVQFGRKSADEALPAPIVGRAVARHTAQVAEAAEVLKLIPAEGESLHCLLTGRFDLCSVLVALIDKLGSRIESCRMATLAYSRKNLADLLKLLDSGKVGTMSLLCSKFFAQHNTDLFTEALTEFRSRGQRTAAARSHAKIITLAAANGQKYAIEASANLRQNGNVENMTLYRDATLFQFHSDWIDAWVSRHEGDEGENEGTR